MQTVLIVSVGLLAAATSLVSAQQSSSPGPSTSPIPILQYINEGVNPDGSYKWSYETGNEIVAEEEGFLKNAGKADEEVQTARGRYAYTAPDGTRIELEYTADENGFRPIGTHLPTPPPIPAAIQRALEWIAAHPGPESESEDIAASAPEAASAPAPSPSASPSPSAPLSAAASAAAAVAAASAAASASEAPATSPPETSSTTASPSSAAPSPSSSANPTRR